MGPASDVNCLLAKIGHQAKELLAALNYGIDGLRAEHFGVELLAPRCDAVNSSSLPQHLAGPTPHDLGERR